MTRNANGAGKLLVVSRDSALLRPLWSMGESNGWQLEIAADPWEAIDRTQSGAPDLLLLDLPQKSGEGLQTLRWLRRLCPALTVILIGHPDDNGRQQEGIRMGARDYLIRPLDDRQLEMAIQRSLSKVPEFNESDIASEDVEAVNERFFIGVSPIMRKLRAQVALLAEVNVPVLIVGESGSGKETTARLIHSLSVRSGFGFAKVNCAALPGDLLERELFGFDKGGVASSTRVKTGKMDLCANGTIFLDEITEMPASLRSNLLQVVKNKQFIRPGNSDLVAANVRIVTSSSTKVQYGISEHRLGEELYHQLSAYTIHVPPLRERKEELSFLSRHFMHRLAKHYGLAPREFSPAILEAWQAYSWPGNLRELEHRVKRYLMVGDEELAFGMSRFHGDGDVRDGASARSLVSKQVSQSTIQSRTAGSNSKSLRSLVQSVKAEAEKTAIGAALEKTGWNRKAAARLLKVSYRTVLYKIEEYHLTAPQSSLYLSANGLGGAEPGFRGNGHAKDLSAGIFKDS